jgi:3-deoxy-D-manno-octulosonic-acid transferase
VIAIFNPKIRLGVAGRKETFQVLEEDLAPDLARMWFHCASLGEYEQGLPVFEALKKALSRTSDCFKLFFSFRL